MKKKKTNVTVIKGKKAKKQTPTDIDSIIDGIEETRIKCFELKQQLDSTNSSDPKTAQSIFKKRESYFPEILDQDEMDYLLNAIASGDSELEQLENAKEQRRVKIYDFRRPDKFTKDQMRTLQMMHETFARLVTMDLSKRLNTLCGVHVASVDQLTWEEFIRSIPGNTCCAAVNLDGYTYKSAIEIDPCIAFSIIDTLAGGNAGHRYKDRPFTKIDNAILKNECDIYMKHLNEAWSNVHQCGFSANAIENKPTRLQIVSPNEMCVLITMEARVGDIEGMFNICYPYIVLEPFLTRLNAEFWFSSIRFNDDNVPVPDFNIDTSVSVYGGITTLREIDLLKPGSVLAIQNIHDSTMTADLHIGNKFITRKDLKLNERNVNFDINEGSIGDIFKDKRKMNKVIREKSFVKRRMKTGVSHVIRYLVKNSITKGASLKKNIICATRKNILKDFLAKIDEHKISWIIENQSLPVVSLILSRVDQKQRDIIFSKMPIRNKKQISSMIIHTSSVSPFTEYAVVKGIKKELSILKDAAHAF